MIILCRERILLRFVQKRRLDHIQKIKKSPEALLRVIFAFLFYCVLLKLSNQFVAVI